MVNSFIFVNISGPPRLAMVFLPVVLAVLSLIQWLAFYLFHTRGHPWSYILEVSRDGDDRRDILRYDARTCRPLEVRILFLLSNIWLIFGPRDYGIPIIP